ncbi:MULTISPECIES: serine/threonine-protein kinase [unclassified Streptomyces]|uniref:serine/threonine-protein kinase n=1 Tax=unclassified Streptomyces TaxID=2593676 RepID=UPI001BE97988|nr:MULTISPECIES: serine/threonine-protein kinase [unclassified Streptomyces]MBT2405375.1 serine/threonine protein kinase [Streptomyces sp. ISL-21]MBT2612226.1 serine/threonine protein kinase [Streptomyces sp. ISL-87]
MSNVWTVPGYTEVRDLGSGGSGRVVLAVHDGTGTAVAVKYLSDRLREDPAFVREFRAEARLLGGLRSPYVVALYEYCEYVEAPGGAAIVMELVDGVSLRALLKQSGPADAEAALVVLKGSLLGLAAAHRAGVVHRDYKPENVLVAADGSSKLVDFGIAAGRGTTPGVAGTPAYMAPEQWQGQPASPAADVYAATATFFECLTGRKPYEGANFAELAVQHIEAPVPETEAPEPVRPLIRRGLAKLPEERPENAEAFVAELEGVALAAYGPDWEERGQRKLAALAALLPLLFPSAGAPAAGTTAVATTSLRHSSGWSPGRRGLASAGAALVLGVVLVLTYDAAGGEPGGAAALSAFATTSATPVTGSPTPPPTPSASPSPTPSPSLSASPSASPSLTPSPSPSHSPYSPTPTPTLTTPTTKPPTTPPPSPKPTVIVGSVAVTVRQTGSALGEATVTVKAKGGPVTVTLEWFTGDTQGQLGAPDGAADTLTYQPGGPATLSRTHTFSGKGCYWGVRATTKPAAGNGSSTDQVFIRRCTIT